MGCRATDRCPPRSLRSRVDRARGREQVVSSAATPTRSMPLTICSPTPSSRGCWAPRTVRRTTPSRSIAERPRAAGSRRSSSGAVRAGDRRSPGADLKTWIGDDGLPASPRLRHPPRAGAERRQARPSGTNNSRHLRAERVRGTRRAERLETGATICIAGRVTASRQLTSCGARGKSGHHRAGRWGNPRRRKPTESGTESKPPPEHLRRFRR